MITVRLSPSVDDIDFSGKRDGYPQRAQCIQYGRMRAYSLHEIRKMPAFSHSTLELFRISQQFNQGLVHNVLTYTHTHIYTHTHTNFLCYCSAAAADTEDTDDLPTSEEIALAKKRREQARRRSEFVALDGREGDGAAMGASRLSTSLDCACIHVNMYTEVCVCVCVNFWSCTMACACAHSRAAVYSLSLSLSLSLSPSSVYLSLSSPHLMNHRRPLACIPRWWRWRPTATR